MLGLNESFVQMNEIMALGCFIHLLLDKYIVKTKTLLLCLNILITQLKKD
jgi:hypothetical protein